MDNLPVDVLGHIASFQSAAEVLRIRTISKAWSEAVDHRLLLVKAVRIALWPQENLTFEFGTLLGWRLDPDIVVAWSQPKYFPSSVGRDFEHLDICVDKGKTDDAVESVCRLLKALGTIIATHIHAEAPVDLCPILDVVAANRRITSLCLTSSDSSTLPINVEKWLSKLKHLRFFETPHHQGVPLCRLLHDLPNLEHLAIHGSTGWQSIESGKLGEEKIDCVLPRSLHYHSIRSKSGAECIVDYYIERNAGRYLEELHLPNAEFDIALLRKVRREFPRLRSLNITLSEEVVRSFSEMAEVVEVLKGLEEVNLAAEQFPSTPILKNAYWCKRIISKSNPSCLTRASAEAVWIKMFTKMTGKIDCRTLVLTFEFGDPEDDLQIANLFEQIECLENLVIMHMMKSVVFLESVRNLCIFAERHPARQIRVIIWRLVVCRHEADSGNAFDVIRGFAMPGNFSIEVEQLRLNL